jgi:hypothetical protein
MVAVPLTVSVGIVTVPVKVGDALSALLLTADCKALNSVSMSVPTTTFKGLPVVNKSLAAKFVALV